MAEIKDDASFKQWVADVDEKFEKAANLSDRVGDVENVLKETVETLKGMSRRDVSDEDTAAKALPFSKSDWQTMGFNAAIKAPTKVERKGPGEYDEPEKGDVYAQFQDACDKLLLIASWKGWVQGSGGEEPMYVDPRRLKTLKFYNETFAPLRAKVAALGKAATGFDTADAGEGLEWVPTEYTRRLWEKLRLEYRVLGLFEEISIPRSPFVLPTFLGDLTAYRFSENTATTGQTAIVATPDASDTVTGKMTFASETLAMMCFWSWELDEDSIVGMLPFLERALIFGLRNGLEDAALNGDTDGTHMDSDAHALGATDRRWVWDGLRKYGLAATAKQDAGGSTIGSDANWNAYVGGVRGGMGVYGIDGNRVAIITGPFVANQIRGAARFATQYAFGSQAGNTISNVNNGGFSPDGMGFVVSEFSRENLNAAGVYDGVTTNLCNAVLVHRDVWKLGVQRAIRTQVLRERYAEMGQYAVIGSWRGDFQNALGAAGSSNNSTGIVYDIARS